MARPVPSECSTCRSLVPRDGAQARASCSIHGWGIASPLTCVCRDWSHAEAPPGWSSRHDFDGLLLPDTLYEIHGAYEAFVEVQDLSPQEDTQIMEVRNLDEPPDFIPFPF